MKLTITGRPIVKKNRMRLVKSGGRTFPIPSKAYKTFEQSAVLQINGQRKKKAPLVGYLMLDLHFYIKGKYHVDLDNLISSICDVLQTAGVIDDDDQIIGIVASKHGGSGGWSTKINIREA